MVLPLADSTEDVHRAELVRLVADQEASIRRLNAEVESHRHEAQDARRSERDAWRAVEERRDTCAELERIITALNAQLAAAGAREAILQAQLDKVRAMALGYLAAVGD